MLCFPNLCCPYAVLYIPSSAPPHFFCHAVRSTSFCMLCCMFPICGSSLSTTPSKLRLCQDIGLTLKVNDMLCCSHVLLNFKFTCFPADLEFTKKNSSPLLWKENPWIWPTWTVAPTATRQSGLKIVVVMIFTINIPSSIINNSLSKVFI